MWLNLKSAKRINKKKRVVDVQRIFIFKKRGIETKSSLSSGFFWCFVLMMYRRIKIKYIFLKINFRVYTLFRFLFTLSFLFDLFVLKVS